MTAMDGQTVETFACVWDALMDSPAEAAAMRVRSDLLSAICDTVAGWDVTRAAAAQHLHLTRLRLDELLRGCVSRFSIDDLIGIATRADLDVRVQAKPASARQNAADAEESRTHECSAEERALLGEAFSALRRERGKAWIDACRRADERGKRRPGLRTAGIDEIKRLARRFGTKAQHWTERP
jgi:predicted XRE-type DNA-binding protein